MRPFLTDIMITRVSCIGSILIFGLGLNLVLGSKIKIGNLLPAVFANHCLSVGFLGIRQRAVSGTWYVGQMQLQLYREEG